MRRLLIALALCATPALASDAWFGGLSPGFKKVAAGGGPTTIAEDNFTDSATNTLIGNSHALDSGGTWTRNSGFGTGELTNVGGDKYYITASAFIAYPATGTPSDPDYTITATVVRLGGASSTSHEMGVLGRASTSQHSGYQCVIRNDSTTQGHLQFRDMSNNTVTNTLGTGTTFNYAGAGDSVVTLTMTGDQISCSIANANVTETLGPVTNGSWTAAGVPSIRGNTVTSSTQGFAITYWKATN